MIVMEMRRMHPACEDLPRISDSYVDQRVHREVWGCSGCYHQMVGSTCTHCSTIAMHHSAASLPYLTRYVPSKYLAGRGGQSRLILNKALLRSPLAKDACPRPCKASRTTCSYLLIPSALLTLKRQR